MATKASQRQARYDATHCKAYGFKLNVVYDADIIERLTNTENKQDYIKKAIRHYIAAGNSTGSVMVNLSPVALETLTERAQAAGTTVQDIVTCIINESVLRNELIKTQNNK